MKIITSDIAVTGAITGRTSGLQVTLANPKAGKLGTEIKAMLQCAPEGYKLVSFDFSGQEMTICAAYNSAEYCDSNWILREALAAPGSRAVLLGRAVNGTDFHTVAAKEVGVERSHSKTLSFSILYGAGIKSCCNLLRPLLAGVEEPELLSKVTSYVEYLKGAKVRGKFLNGQFSDFFNFADRLIKESHAKLPFGGQKITNTLSATNSNNDYYTSKMNWTVQGSGSALLDYLGTKVDEAIFENGYEEFMWFQFSCHDQLGFICHDDYITELASIVRKAYALTWRVFFKSLDMTCPIEVQENIEITADVIDRKEPTTSFNTSSQPSWLNDVADGVVV